MTQTIKARDRDTILQALAAGVVPRTGLRHIQVGRAAEVGALVRDIDRIADGGSAMRFVIGEYGAGKTFFLNLIRLIALERKCVTLHADLAPDRRVHATSGQARGLYSEAVRNMATRTKPEGGALASVVERFVTECVKDGEARGVPVEKAIDDRLAQLQEHVGGYDYAAVLKAYWRGSEEGDEALKAAALRWLRGEYSTKTEARQALNVRNIIDDGDVYDSLKLLAAFVRLAGYAGMLVVFDEMVNLYKLQSAQARNQNYEQILRMLNDVLQGNVSGLGFVLGGTPEFLMDTRRGLYSYQALQSRLAENAFATKGLVDLSGPVLRLQSLTPEDLLILLSNIRAVFAGGDQSAYLVPEEAFPAFMTHCNQRIGEAYFRTPRNTIKAFVQFLAVLEQNPGTDWKGLLGGVEVFSDVEAPTEGPDGEGSSAGDDELASLRL
ncbi:ATP-binding protein [Chenggangzhangella methanolivorans]|uniref:ATP-binding protein n=1 Tax=Chenggangzhangella methanolivorans TaxID=1437009 RepID=A0A9E6R7H4_9HYPH|nr:ATP-binding protein [Chenggangzhangella methanolivorans]QZN99635.1 ATP-binding protein [Chenggangzhangella methanolivorans]